MPGPEDIFLGSAFFATIWSLRFGRLADNVIVPSVKNGAFSRWFDNLTPDELEELWLNQRVREAIESRLRSPGGMHEWHCVSRTPVFKRWGLKAEQIIEMRSVISSLQFVNPSGAHTGFCATKLHKELFGIIDSSLTYDDFVRRLRVWANYRLVGGAHALPPGLRP